MGEEWQLQLRDMLHRARLDFTMKNRVKNDEEDLNMIFEALSPFSKKSKLGNKVSDVDWLDLLSKVQRFSSKIAGKVAVYGISTPSLVTFLSPHFLPKDGLAKECEENHWQRLEEDMATEHLAEGDHATGDSWKVMDVQEGGGSMADSWKNMFLEALEREGCVVPKCHACGLLLVVRICSHFISYSCSVYQCSVDEHAELEDPEELLNDEVEWVISPTKFTA